MTIIPSSLHNPLVSFSSNRNSNNYNSSLLLLQAKLAEEAERYDDMVQNVKALAELNTQLNVEERNLLSVAYKNVVGARRASWRVLSSIESKEKEKGDNDKVIAITEYRDKVERELEKICLELLDVLEKHLLPEDHTAEGQVFYWKMAGDYWRYLAEFATTEDRKVKAENAKQKYDRATKTAQEKGLPPTNPIRLGLALNYSVFYFEILNQPQEACSLAKTAFDDAISELDSLQEEQYKDATLIMQLIRDNLTLWTSDSAEGDDKGEDLGVEDVEN